MDHLVYRLRHGQRAPSRYDHVFFTPNVLSDLLASGELELGPPERLDDGLLVLVVRAHRHQRLTDPHAGHRALRLAERAPHPRLFKEGDIFGQIMIEPASFIVIKTYFVRIYRVGLVVVDLVMSISI